jgi:hypothetical protein
MNPASTATITRATRPPARHREQGHPSGAELNVTEHHSPHADRNELANQHLTIVLEGITAGDYLTSNFPVSPAAAPAAGFSLTPEVVEIRASHP